MVSYVTKIVVSVSYFYIVGSYVVSFVTKIVVSKVSKIVVSNVTKLVLWIIAVSYVTNEPPRGKTNNVVSD